MKLISVIVPVRDDAQALSELLAQLPGAPEVELIVVSAGDDDELAAMSRVRGDVKWMSAVPGRGRQLNAGAAVAQGEWLWFVHADSTLPDGWLDAFRQLDADSSPIVTRSAQPAGVVGGSFRFALRSPAWQARIIERGVAARVRWLNLPFGDQGIFVRRSVFLAMNGFTPLPLLEDVEFIARLKRVGRLRHLTLSVTTSARKWLREGWWRRSGGNLLILVLYWLGVSPDRLARRYYRETRRAA